MLSEGVLFLTWLFLNNRLMRVLGAPFSYLSWGLIQITICFINSKNNIIICDQPFPPPCFPASTHFIFVTAFRISFSACPASHEDQFCPVFFPCCWAPPAPAPGRFNCAWFSKAFCRSFTSVFLHFSSGLYISHVPLIPYFIGVNHYCIQSCCFLCASWPSIVILLGTHRQTISISVRYRGWINFLLPVLKLIFCYCLSVCSIFLHFFAQRASYRCFYA